MAAACAVFRTAIWIGNPGRQTASTSVRRSDRYSDWQPGALFSTSGLTGVLRVRQFGPSSAHGCGVFGERTPCSKPLSVVSNSADLIRVPERRLVVLSARPDLSQSSAPRSGLLSRCSPAARCSSSECQMCSSTNVVVSPMAGLVRVEHASLARCQAPAWTELRPRDLAGFGAPEIWWCSRTNLSGEHTNLVGRRCSHCCGGRSRTPAELIAPRSVVSMAATWPVFKTPTWVVLNAPICAVSSSPQSGRLVQAAVAAVLKARMAKGVEHTGFTGFRCSLCGVQCANLS